MKRFIEKYSDKLQGVLSGFDRLLVKGTLRPLSYTAGMMGFLYHVEVLLKDFGEYVERVSKRLKEASLETAQRLGRPITYLASGRTRKEPVARKIAERDGITEGLICVLSCVEPCMSYDIYRNRKERRLELRGRQRKCLWLYHYWMDERWGLMSGRIQSWFPFDVYICLNGREWLAREMDRAGMRYQRGENCFLWIEDVEEAQRLMRQQLDFPWVSELESLSLKLNPAHQEIVGHLPIDYYWTVRQSEWATDLMFRSAQLLEGVYPQLVRGAMGSFGSADVMRFLGKKLHGNFGGELTSDFKARAEGMRVKHRGGANSVKMYDKHGRVLRVETTIDDPAPFKVYRPVEGDPEGKKAWRPLARGIANLRRLAEVSQSCNERYLDALASLDTDSPLEQLMQGVCEPLRWKGERVRALRPWEEPDRRLLETIDRGEFAINGFRNRDLRSLLFPEASSLPPEQRRRYAARVTRKLRMLRAHGIIRKVNKTHRYLLTKRGRQTVTAILQCRQVTLAQLERACA